MNIRRRLRAVLGAGIAAAALAVIDGGAGCGGSSATPSGTQPDAQPVCPATLVETIGATCAVYGLVCGPSYACGATQVPLLCVCDGSAFQCTDGAGNTVDSADAASCPAPIDAGSSCPRTESAARVATCRSPGLLCEYPSSCPSSFDQCECFPGATADGGFGLRFECTPAACVSSDAALVVIDAGVDSNLDSGADVDSASYVDSGPGVDSAGYVDSGPDDSASDVDSSDAEFSHADSGVDAPNENDSSSSDARTE